MSIPLNTPDDFWLTVDRLVAESVIRIERPKGTTHP